MVTQDRDWNGFLLSLFLGLIVMYWERAQELGWVAHGPHGQPLVALPLGSPLLGFGLFFGARMLYRVGVFNRADRAA